MSTVPDFLRPKRRDLLQKPLPLPFFDLPKIALQSEKRMVDFHVARSRILWYHKTV